MKISVIPCLQRENTFVRAHDNLRHVVFQKALTKTKTLTNLAEDLIVSKQNVSRYKLGQRDMPLQKFEKLLSIVEINLQAAVDQIEFKIGKLSKFYLKPFVEINPEWVYIAELIRCDGYIHRNLWSCSFTNNNEALLDCFVDFFKMLGVPHGQINVRNSVTSSCKIVTVRSKTLAFIFNKIFEIPAGRKGEIHLPAWYFRNIEFLTAAIRGAFDGEGCVQTSFNLLSPRRIAISNKSQRYLRNLAMALKEIGIDSFIRHKQKGREIYELFIYGKINLEKFLTIVNPRHDKRKKKLESLLKTYNEKRIPEGSLRKNLLKSLVNEPKRRSEIALELNIPKKKLGWHLKWSRENGLINVNGRFYTGNGSYFVYGITEKGERFLSDENGALRD